jgi:regulatory protein
MGKSSRIITMKLRNRGVDADTITDVLIHTDEDEGGSKHADVVAARIYVRKRKLRDKDPHKALAALGRQGFSFDVAKRALANDDDD